MVISAIECVGQVRHMLIHVNSTKHQDANTCNVLTYFCLSLNFDTDNKSVSKVYNS